MSSKIKNTLFRFVSMRSPELTTDYGDNTGFILQPLSASGAFNDAVNIRPAETTKLEALKTASITFTPQTLEQIKALNTALYEFSVWVAKNRNRAIESEVLTKLNGVTNLDTDSTLVWQNLYYQVITQKDFYAKEALMQLLLANHIVENHQTADVGDLLKAKVILPKALFIEDADESNSASGTQPLSATPASPVSFANPAMQRLETASILEADNKLFGKLKTELKKAEKTYRKKYKTEYDKQLQAHQDIIKPILDQYQIDIENANSNWCSVKDPSVEYDPEDPCNRPPKVPEPTLPKFEFTYMDELDKDFLANQLSTESKTVLDTLLDSSLITSKLDAHNKLTEDIIPTLDFDSYENAYESLQRIIDENGEIVMTNTVEEPDTTVFVGGEEFESYTNASNLEPFQYEVKTRRLSYLNDLLVLSLMVGIPSPSWRMTSISYKLTRLDDTFEEGTDTWVNHFPNYDHFKGIPMLGIDSNFKELSATIQFENGEEKTLLVSDFDLENIYRGYLFTETQESEEGTENGSSVNPDAPFIPTGFGVKQLGIADYNKVEQTIQGYLDGEVAHIENIMAREFKEKSTRRLRRKEETNTNTTETEREKLTDTTSVDRFEMQSEVASVIQESQDLNTGANVNAHYGNGDSYSVDIGAFANFATHNATEESALQAVTTAKEITERALDRMVNKVKEERIEKIVEEFEENNTHGFDNRKGDKHVVGVYRWVDKLFKNQIINYGKRLMFEFMIPEPGKLHKLALNEFSGKNKLHKPLDPRKVGDETLKLESYKDLDIDSLNDSKLKYWAGIYNVEFRPKPEKYITIGKSFSQSKNHVEQGFTDSKEDTIQIPENYESQSVSMKLHGGASFGPLAGVGIGSHIVNGGLYSKWARQGSDTLTATVPNYRGAFPVSYISVSLHNSSGTVQLKCIRTKEAETQWQQETFNAIIKAYKEALAEYEQKLAEQKASGVQILGTNPGLYREIENTVLRKNCISYLLDNNPQAKRTFGKSFYTSNRGTDTVTFSNAMVNQNSDLDDYAAFVKFMEQAFEWNIMSYNFYPYYWANSDDWGKMYNYSETHDHVFKAFMQSGMARVIVTVRPGFEEAVRYYMQTGQIWNGGEVPVIEDELYLSIVDELRAPKGEKVGKAWWTRIPTALTILQAKSIGLNVIKALPYNEDLSDFEDPESVPQSTEFELSQAQIGTSQNTGTARLFGEITGNNGVEAKILLKRIDGSIQDITYTDTNGDWELNNLPAGRFELLLDADDDFPTDTHQVTAGSKEQVVELENDQIVEVNLTVSTVA